MYNKTGNYSLSLGVFALAFQLIEPQWFEFLIFGLILVLATLIFVSTGIAALFIRLFKPKLVTFTNLNLLMSIAGAVLLAYVSMVQQEEYAVYGGIALGIVFFIAALIFQRKGIK